jgi:hypothetical protein
MSKKVKVWKRPFFIQGIMYRLVITTKKNKRRTKLDMQTLLHCYNNKMTWTLALMDR